MRPSPFFLAFRQLLRYTTKMKEIKPFKSGYINADGHKISYRAYGNPQGVPWLFCHGGPGFFCIPKSNLKNFNLKKDLVILFDQRGAGLSRPHTELKNNTTKHLVEDMKSILEVFKLEKVNIFGGSWGSTLALVFALTYPEKVKSLVVKGVFLGRGEDLDAMYKPQDSWDREKTQKYEGTLGKMMKKYKLKHIFDGINVLKKKDEKAFDFARHWAAYEDSICSRGFELYDFDKEYLSMSIAISMIEIHYFRHNCFLPENFILANIKKISHIPLFIVQGGDDLVCPKNQALELAKLHPMAELYVDPQGGHSSSEAMNEALRTMVKKASKL